ncbi:MAG: ABC transporter substrate-binding protein [Magnetococcales bacterium]|nr:ABC transporter substrate-binding protein [Magnetococcales bacterium]
MKLLPLLILLSLALPARADHGLSLDGHLKYPSGFERFAFTSPQAKVGGGITLHAIGAFDKMNPFTLKGSAPDLVGRLVFESLTVQSQDEPFSQYGLLARDIAVAADGLGITYELHPQARFADGSPVTAADVAFSFATLKSDQAHPFYRSYWQDVARAEILDPHRIRFHFARKNRELPMITGELPVFSKAFHGQHDFAKGDLTPPLGSGPYRVGRVQAGQTITFERNPDYWGRDLPVRRGLHNFNQVTVKYFKDPVVALEGFKAGEFDFIHVNNSKQWARDYQGDKFDRGLIVKTTLPHRNGAGMQGFVLNLRRPLFQDIRVRRALGLAFDFEWSNSNLFHGQYTRSESYFSNSELAATGAPTPEELALLEPFRDRLDPAVFGPAPRPPSTAAPGSLRDNLRQAVALLKEAGWRMGPNGLLVDPKGHPLRIDALLVSPDFERVLGPYAANLKKIGVGLEYRTVDPALYQRRIDAFDFDLIVHSYGQSQSPGNEQRDSWHSVSADIPGSRNLMGLKDPVVDALVDRLIYVSDRPALLTACRALDRVLRAGHYLVPHFHIPYHRVAYWNRFEHPVTPPLYYSPEDWLFAWWVKDR